MKTAVSGIFRILIPLLCLLTVGAYFLMGVELHLSEENQAAVHDALALQQSAAAEDPFYEDGGRTFVYSAAEDGVFSAAEMIGIHSKTNIPAEDVSGMASEPFFTVAATVINRYYGWILALLIVFLVGMTAAAVTVLFPPGRADMVILTLSVVLFAGGMIGSVVLLQKKVVQDLNVLGVPAWLSMAGLLAVIGAALTVVLHGIYLSLFLMSRNSSPEGLIYAAEEEKGTLEPASVSSQTQLVTGAASAVRPVRAIEQVPAPRSVSVLQPALAPEPPVFSVQCVAGVCSPRMLSFPPDGSVLIGRDGERCQMTVPLQQISRQHCRIAYYATKDRFAVTDFSQNGVYTESGIRLLPGYANLLPPGSVICLAGREIAFRLMKS